MEFTSWNRYSEDFDILKELNQNAYRFSLEWSRLIPSKGEIDGVAIEHIIHHFMEPSTFCQILLFILKSL
ncbi:MAG: family 1 glycosylhydrolase [Candidatus Bathyarchaeia archaeon]